MCYFVIAFAHVRDLSKISGYFSRKQDGKIILVDIDNAFDFYRNSDAQRVADKLNKNRLDETDGDAQIFVVERSNEPMPFEYCPKNTAGLEELTFEDRILYLFNCGVYTAKPSKTWRNIDRVDMQCTLDNWRIPTHRIIGQQIPAYGSASFTRYNTANNF